MKKPGLNFRPNAVSSREIIMATVSNSIIIGCWIIFLAYWLISARRVKTTAERQTRASSFAHRIPVALSYVLLMNPGLPPPLNLVLTPRTDWAHVTGAVVCVAGLFVTVWARRTLAGNWSSTVTFKQGHELIKAGPYHFVRHPIYTGLLLMCLGSAIDIGRLRGWLGLAAMFFGFWIKLKQEESLLLRHFPDDYPAYKKQVKAIVPFVI
jgi:protein-S-isoprenylcysteine O-methyltransferase Ste14